MAAGEGQVISCHTVESWDEQFAKGKGNNQLIVVDFTASWCPPCRFMNPILAEWAKKMPEVTFLKVDVDELRDVAEKWEVEAMPTFLLLKNGVVVDKVVGAVKDELLLKITTHSGVPASA